MASPTVQPEEHWQQLLPRQHYYTFLPVPQFQQYYHQPDRSRMNNPSLLLAHEKKSWGVLDNCQAVGRRFIKLKKTSGDVERTVDWISIMVGVTFQRSPLLFVLCAAF